jgi:hypothetical protein
MGGIRLEPMKTKTLRHQNESGGLPTFLLLSQPRCLDENAYSIEGKTCEHISFHNNYAPKNRHSGQNLWSDLLEMRRYIFEFSLFSKKESWKRLSWNYFGMVLLAMPLLLLRHLAMLLR